MPRTLEQIDAALAALESNNFSIPALGASISTFVDSQRIAWTTAMAARRGSADAVITDPAGQPAPGWYPVTDPDGVTTWEPSTARIQADASALDVQFIQMSGTNTLNLNSTHSGKVLSIVGTTSTSTVTVNLPGNVAANWNCLFIQAGSGTGRLSFGIQGSGFLRSRGSAFRSAGDDAIITAICRQRDSSSRSTISIAGDLIV